MKLRYIGPDRLRRVNGRVLRHGDIISDQLEVEHLQHLSKHFEVADDSPRSEPEPDLEVEILE